MGLPLYSTASKERANGRPEFSEDLSFFVQRQVDKLIALGFHDKIYTKYSRDKREARYRNDFKVPKDFSPPMDLRARTREYLVVDPRISLESHINKTGITDFVVAKSVRNLNPLPQQPYLSLLFGSFKDSPYSQYESPKHFREDEVGSPLLEVVSLYLQKPESFRGVSIYAPGSIKQDVQPHLMIYYDRPEIHIANLGFSDMHRRGLTRYKNVVLLGK